MKQILHYNSDDSIPSLIPGVRFSTVTDPIFIHGYPRWSDVCQTDIGNCYLLSALKSIGLRNNKFIQSIIQDQGNGRVRVRLFTPVHCRDSGYIKYHAVHYIVDKSIKKEGKRNAHKATWVDLIEKAYALHRYYLAEKSGIQQNLSYESILDAGQPSDVYRHLLGEVAGQRESAYLKFSGLASLTMSLSMFEEYSILKENDDQLGTTFSNNYSSTFFFEDDDQLKLLKNLFNNDALCDDFVNNFPRDHYVRYHKLIQDYVEDEKFDDAVFKTELDVILQNLQPKVREIVEDTILKAKRNEQKNHRAYHDDLYNFLFTHLQAGELVCCGTNISGSLLKGLPKKHAYHIINVYERNGERFVQLDNPWGHTTPLYNRNEKKLIVGESSVSDGSRYNTRLGDRRCKAITYEPKQQTAIDNSLGTFELPLDVFIQNFSKVHTTKLTVSHQQAMADVEIMQNEVAQARSDLKQSVKLAEGEEPNFDEIDAVTQKLSCLEVIHDQAEQHENHLSSIRHDLTPPREVSDPSSGSINPETHSFVPIPMLTPPSTPCGGPATPPIVLMRDTHHDILTATVTELTAYLAGFKQEVYESRNSFSRFTHRLSSTKPDRYISAERRDRAHVVLALIDAYQIVDSEQDKNMLLAILQDIMKHHAAQHNRIKNFHGNRLGQALSRLGELTINDTLEKCLSIEADAVIVEKLEKHGFTSTKLTGHIALDSSITFAQRIRRFNLNAEENNSSDTLAPSVATNTASLFVFARPQTSLFTNSDEEYPVVDPR